MLKYFKIFGKRNFWATKCSNIFYTLSKRRAIHFWPYLTWILMLESIFLVFWKDKFIVDILCFISLLMFCLEFEIFKFKVVFTSLYRVMCHAWHHQLLISQENKCSYEKNNLTFVSLALKLSKKLEVKDRVRKRGVATAIDWQLNKSSIMKDFQKKFWTISGAVSSVSLEKAFWLTKYLLFVHNARVWKECESPRVAVEGEGLSCS